MRKRGLTLAELLVALAIISLLVTLGVVLIREATERSKRTVCAQKMRQIWVALENYRQDWGGIDPPAAKTMTQAGLPRYLYSERWFIASYTKSNPDGFYCSLRYSPAALISSGCAIPCFEQGRLSACTASSCLIYYLGWQPRFDENDEYFPGLESVERQADIEDKLLEKLGMRYEVVYDPFHNSSRASEMFHLFIRLDGSFYAKRTLRFPDLRYWQYELYVEGGSE